MIPLIIDAVEHYAMLGEVCARLRAIWGEQHDGHGAVGVVFDVAC